MIHDDGSIGPYNSIAMVAGRCMPPPPQEDFLSGRFCVRITSSGDVQLIVSGNNVDLLPMIAELSTLQ
jgi:hypothetical protein